MKTLWLTFDTGDGNAYGTLFEGGDITDGDGWIRFDNIKEIEPTSEDIKTIVGIFQSQLSSQ